MYFLHRNRKRAKGTAAVPDCFPVAGVVKANHMGFMRRLLRAVRWRAPQTLRVLAADETAAFPSVGRTEFRVRPFLGRALVQRRTMDYGAEKWKITQCLLDEGSVWLKSVFDLSGLDLRGFDFTGLRIHASISDVNFGNCNFGRLVVSGEQIFTFEKGRGYLRRVVFDGSSLRDAVLSNCELEEVSFRGCDLTGASFGDVRSVKSLDVTDSNISKEQYEILRSKCFSVDEQEIVYRKFTVGEACEVLGLDSEEFVALVWLEEIEMRDASGSVPSGPVDLNAAHVPQWEIQRILAAEQVGAKPQNTQHNHLP